MAVGFRHLFSRHLFSRDEIVDMIQHSGVGLLVIGDTGTHFMQETIQTILEETDCPILVVR